MVNAAPNAGNSGTSGHDIGKTLIPSGKLHPEKKANTVQLTPGKIFTKKYNPKFSVFPVV